MGSGGGPSGNSSATVTGPASAQGGGAAAGFGLSAIPGTVSGGFSSGHGGPAAASATGADIDGDVGAGSFWGGAWDALTMQSKFDVNEQQAKAAQDMPYGRGQQFGHAAQLGFNLATMNPISAAFNALALGTEGDVDAAFGMDSPGGFAPPDPDSLQPRLGLPPQPPVAPPEPKPASAPPVVPVATPAPAPAPPPTPPAPEVPTVPMEVVVPTPWQRDQMSAAEIDLRNQRRREREAALAERKKQEELSVLEEMLTPKPETFYEERTALEKALASTKKPLRRTLRLPKTG